VNADWGRDPDNPEFNATRNVKLAMAGSSTMSDRSEGFAAEQSTIMSLFEPDTGQLSASGLYAATAAASEVVPDLIIAAEAVPGGMVPVDAYAPVTATGLTYSDGATSNFQTCSCCAGFHFKPSEADGTGSSNEGAAGETGSLQQLADYLRVGYWASTGANARSWGAGATVTYNVQDLSTAERALAREALGLYDDFANINFSEVTTGGQIVFNNNGNGLAGTSNGNQTAAGLITSKTIGISSDWNGDNINTGFNSYKYQTYIHEIGHAIGLGHQGPYNGTADWATQRSYDNDSWRYSIMSYHNQVTSSQGSYSFVTTPQMADIRALQDMYGARNARTGDTTYGYNSNAGTSYNFSASGLNGATSFTIYDSGGTDTIDGSGYNGAQDFNLSYFPASTYFLTASSVGGETNNVLIWGGSLIENAIGGGGADTFSGNSANNVFVGGGGIDQVNFSGLRSTYVFQENFDSYSVTSSTDGTDFLNSIERFRFFDTNVITDDFRVGSTTLGTLAIGGSRTGDTQFLNDRDWFAVQLQAGKNYVIELKGGGPLNATLGLADPLVRLHNSLTAEIASNDDGGYGRNSQLAVNVANSGTYYVNAGAFGTSSYVGTYGVSIHEAATTRFDAPQLKFGGFGASDVGGSWTSDFLFPRTASDINNDGVADIVGFGANGLFVATNQIPYGGSGYNPANLAYAGFGSTAAAGGWTNNDQYTRTIADVNGDGRGDIVGFGAAGTFVALNTTQVGNIFGPAPATFGATNLAVAAFGTAGGWISDDYYHRELADVNGDGRADIVGFGSESVFVSLGQAGGTFATATVAMLNSFGPSAVGGGWSSDNLYPRRMADVNGDGRADIVGFGGNGVFVSLALVQVTPAFAPAFLALNSFGAGFLGGGWTSDDQFPRILGDINGDSRDDIVGFGGNGTFFALGQANGTFGPVVADLAGYGTSAAAGGWSTNNGYPRVLADMSGDGRADIVAFGANGVFVSNSYDFINV
jgi:hypothetical protein